MEQSAQAKLADTRIDDVAINGITPATKTIQAFALTITQMSRQSLERTTQHIERLRKVHSPEEVASIQLEFVRESLEFAAQHTRKVGEMLGGPPARDGQILSRGLAAIGNRCGTDDRGSRARRCGEGRAPCQP
jgi:hypothetical protein